MIYFDDLEFDSELKFEIYILRKYLTIHYGEEKAIALIKNNADDLDKLAKALGEIDIEFFCLYFMSDTFVVKDTNAARTLAPAHHELWALSTDTFVKDLYDKLNIIEPRGKNLNAMPRCYRNIA